VDNQSRNSNTLEYYKELLKNKRIRIISFQDKFNYSTANNIGASNSQGDLLLFMNNDMQITDPYWLNELAQWALIPEIGVVGGKLLYPNGTIQHAGVIIGMQGIGGHLYQHAPDHYIGLLGSSDWYRNVSAVTGACQMLRKSVFIELGGFHEEYQLTFSDIDLCYSAIKQGYRILYNPYSRVIHHQGVSRGFFTPDDDVILARKRIGEFIKNGDPYFSRNLTLSPIPKVKNV
jgi:GT2 family glycosyltransferase